ncbi:putative transcription factor C2H2 family [Rosa chinensis]|uniref:Putative transcription factor C2H2 family n=1 Tax=Rosa chinensis TaxID=74649 RepID=A0A2P6PQV4_ROSCH|nr:zinc finger protein ZAT1 [Rosa chinensis]PRQ24308.1 putative transcription factor C2H2 family [Rosa chinensis]
MKSFQEIENDFHEDQDDRSRRHHKLQNSRDHVCKVCGKRFETGNGLGGHKRIHNLLLPNKKINKFKANEKVHHPSSRDYLKDVRWLQALSVSPSQSSSSSTSSSWCESSSSDLTESDSDLEKSLPIWGRKDVRGRSSTCTSSTTTLIANQTVTNKPREAAKIKTDETSWSDKNMKPKKMMMRSNLEKSRKHVCEICYKEFPTGQALGGHKSSHYYYPGSTASATSIREVPGLDQVVSNEDEEASRPTISRETFEFDLNEIPSEEN